MFYYLGYILKKHFALKGSKKLPYRVISIGNITTGGTGKTPMVIALAEESNRRGLFPIVLTRGYKGRRFSPCFIAPPLKQNPNGHRSEYLCSSTNEAGDEPMLLALRLPNTPVVKHANRYEGALWAIKNLNIFLNTKGIGRIDEDRIFFLIDDGFQHWHLQRDKDILLIDGLNPFGNGMLLPFGRLREPLGALKRAHLFVITRQKNMDAEAGIRRFNNDSPIFYADIKPTGLINMDGLSESCAIIKGRKLFAFAGVGNPESFLKTLESLAPSHVAFKAFKDHHKYTLSDIDDIMAKARHSETDMIITTEKDMAKLREFNRTLDIYAISINMILDNAFYELIFG